MRYPENSEKVCRDKRFGVLKKRELYIDKKIFLIITGILVIQSLFAATVVDFYATKSISDDVDMINMTTNLFYTQMQNIDGYTVIDKRDTLYDDNLNISSHISFYAEIQEDEEGNWVCTLNAIKSDTGKFFSETKTYASYFKILTDAKSSLENLLNNITSPVSQNSSKKQDSDTEQNLDTIAGTWSGEDYIEKIILMRSGRGFVIFKNGASMNVLISQENKNIIITQNGRSNASYYPALSRSIAQKLAAIAEPLKWVFKLSDQTTLTGTSDTFVEDPEAENGVTLVTNNVTWVKK